MSPDLLCGGLLLVGLGTGAALSRPLAESRFYWLTAVVGFVVAAIAEAAWIGLLWGCLLALAGAASLTVLTMLATGRRSPHAGTLPADEVSVAALLADPEAVGIGTESLPTHDATGID